MAQMNKQILGKLKGTIGDVVFRQRKGKAFAYSRPGSFTPGDTPNAVNARDRFGLTVKFGSRVNALTYVKDIWKANVYGDGSAYNLIVKTNYPYVNPSGLTDLVTLVPGYGFSVTTTSVTINAASVQAIVDPIGNNTGIDPVAEPNIVMASVLYLNNPTDPLIASDAFISLLSAQQETDLASQLTFNIPLSSQETQLFNNYQDQKGFFCLVTLDVDNNPVHYSITFIG